MLARTHAYFGLSFGLTSLYLTDITGIFPFRPLISVAYLYFTYKGSMIPDIDHRGSTIGKKYKISSFVIGKLFGHRKFTHSIMFIVLLSLVNFLFLYLLSIWLNQILIEISERSMFMELEISPVKLALFLTAGLALGMVSHIIGDLLTIQGVRLWSPFSQKRFRLPFSFKTGGSIETLLSVLLSVYNGGIALMIFMNNLPELDGMIISLYD